MRGCGNYERTVLFTGIYLRPATTGSFSECLLSTVSIWEVPMVVGGININSPPPLPLLGPTGITLYESAFFVLCFLQKQRLSEEKKNLHGWSV